MIFLNMVLLTSVRLVLAEQDGELSEDSHMGALQAQASLQKPDDFLEMTAALIQLDEGSQLLL